MNQTVQKFAGTEQVYQNVSAQKFNQLMKERPDAILFDVRTPAEIRQRSLKSDLCIDFMESDFEEQLAYLDVNSIYLIYCRSGNRSEQVCRLMRQRGFMNLYNLRDGLMNWPYWGYPSVPQQQSAGHLVY